MDDLSKHWLALSKVGGIGPVRARALLEYFGDPQSAWQASEGELLNAKLPQKVVDSLLQTRQTLDIDQLIEDLQKHKVTLLNWQSENYSRMLKEIDHSPPLFYMKGELRSEDDWAVAVVGTRQISPYGRQLAEELGAFLASQSITLVSGLARGVDSIAQKAALAAGGRTISVLAHGLDQI